MQLVGLFKQDQDRNIILAQSDKELTEIKGYVSRLYQLVRSRTEMALTLTDDQSSQTGKLGDTIEDINTKLQIANSFQQEEIFAKLTDVEEVLNSFQKGVSVHDTAMYKKLGDVEKLLKKLLNVMGAPEDEEFIKVEKWRAFKFSTLPLVGDIIAYFHEESEKSYRIKTPYVVQPYRGPQWVTRGFEMFSLMSVADTVITVERKTVIGPWEVPEALYKEFTSSAAYRSGYSLVGEPWRKAVPTEDPPPELHKQE